MTDLEWLIERCVSVHCTFNGHRDYFHGKYAQMGRAFGVDECAIHHIKSGRSRRHVP